MKGGAVVLAALSGRHIYKILGKCRGKITRLLILTLMVMGLSACEGILFAFGIRDSSSTSPPSPSPGLFTLSYQVLDLKAYPSYDSINITWYNPGESSLVINSFNISWQGYAPNSLNISQSQGYEWIDPDNSPESIQLFMPGAKVEYGVGNLNLSLVYKFEVELGLTNGIGNPACPLRNGICRFIVLGNNHDDDELADVEDNDRDNDMIANEDDSCPSGEISWIANSRSDIDGDGCRDASEDTDDDNDGYPDESNATHVSDNCPLVANSDQANFDGDIHGDACDYDIDNDNVPNWEDIDNDGDGLIDISNAAALGRMAYGLDGTYFNASGGIIMTKGCGEDGLRTCSGYELLADIDLSGYSSWEPIGHCSGDLFCEDDTNKFNTIFSGNGYSINNITISPNESRISVGLFGATGDNSRLTNISLANIEVYEKSGLVLDVAGGLAGYASGVISAVNLINATIHAYYIAGGLVGSATNLTMANSSAEIQEIIASRSSSGGLIGESYDIKIDKSWSRVDFISANQEAGGLLGYGDVINITGSYAITNTITSISDGGGLAGHLEAAEVKLSYAETQNIGITGNNAGGLIGHSNDASIDSSYALTGKITAKNQAGGLIGHASAVTINKSLAMAEQLSVEYRGVGGLVGSTYDLIVDGSYVVADRITSDRFAAGGLVGYTYNLAIAKSYVLVNKITAGSSGSGGLVGERRTDLAPGIITVDSSYWDDDILVLTPTAVNGWGEGLSTAKLQSSSSQEVSSWLPFQCSEGISLWSFQQTSKYPVLGCLGLSTEEQYNILARVLGSI